MKRTRMNRKRRSSTTPAREAWRELFDCCMMPGCERREGLEVHEICGGSDRAKAITMPAAMLLFCNGCHYMFGSRPNQEQLILQLAIKRFSDPEHAHTESVVRLWRPKCLPVLVDEIAAAVEAEYKRLLKEYR